jgi:hypothetical protein
VSRLTAYYPPRHQLSLPPAAANADPLTSKIAAREITRSGARETQSRHAAELVRQAQGLTSLELAARFGECRFRLAKRLSDAASPALGLVTRGPARRCTVSGRSAVTWRSTDGTTQEERG